MAETLEKLCNCFYSLLLRVGRRSGSADPAFDNHDFAQEAILELVTACRNGSITEVRDVRAYLCRIIKNISRATIRRRERRAPHQRRLAYDADQERLSPSSVDEVMAPVCKLEDIDKAKKALAKIPDIEREAFVLRYVSGLSYPEIAVICECPVGTVKSRVHRARKRLQRILRMGE